MKKIFIFIIFMMFFLVPFNIDALCYDEELNEWAVGIEIEFVDFDGTLINEETGDILIKTMDYAYILTLNSQRDDVIMKATNNYDQNLTSIYIPGHKIYGIPNYIAKEPVNYEIKVIGGENSKCPNEVLKVLDYTVDPLNLYYKTELCEDNPDAPLCEVYKDTSNVSQEEFEMEMDKYVEEHKPEPDDTIFDKILDIFFGYVIYALIPIIVIGTYYNIKIKKVKKEEENK